MDLQKKRNLQSIETLEKAARKIDDFLDNNKPRIGRGKNKQEVKSNITDNESAKMSTSKGTIQGYNGVATVDKKHQVIIDAKAFGEGAEQHTLEPIIKTIKTRFNKLGISNNILEDTIITADTGFANEANMKYLHEANIDAYIPDNKFRSRDPKFKHQKQNHPCPSQAKSNLFKVSDFVFDAIEMTCTCPSGKLLSQKGTRKDKAGNTYIYFKGKPSQCKNCLLKQVCMRNPKAANHSQGRGRQVLFRVKEGPKITHTDWMKERVDSDKGKRIYSHRMSVVEPVFGNLGFNKNLKRFSLRGLKKVNTQWTLFCLIHNIEKIANYGRVPALS